MSKFINRYTVTGFLVMLAHSLAGRLHLLPEGPPTWVFVFGAIAWFWGLGFPPAKPMNRYSVIALVGFLILLAGIAVAYYQTFGPWGGLAFLPGAPLLVYGVYRNEIRAKTCKKCGAAALKRTHERGWHDFYTCGMCREVTMVAAGERP